MVRGWAPTLAGAAGAVAALAATVAVLGPLLGRIPLDVLQLVTGILVANTLRAGRRSAGG